MKKSQNVDPHGGKKTILLAIITLLLLALAIQTWDNFKAKKADHAVLVGELNDFKRDTAAYNKLGRIWLDTTQSASVRNDAFYKAMPIALEFYCETLQDSMNAMGFLRPESRTFSNGGVGLTWQHFPDLPTGQNGEGYRINDSVHVIQRGRYIMVKNKKIPYFFTMAIQDPEGKPFPYFYAYGDGTSPPWILQTLFKNPYPQDFRETEAEELSHIFD